MYISRPAPLLHINEIRRLSNRDILPLSNHHSVTPCNMSITPLLVAAVLVCCSPSPTNAQPLGCSSSFTDSQVTYLLSNYVPTLNAYTIVLQNSTAGFTFRLVCLDSSSIRDHYSTVSLVAYFTLTDSSGGVMGPMYGQFEFLCYSGLWYYSRLFYIQDSSVILTSAAPAISAPLRTDCAYCLNTKDTDPVNHCYRELSSVRVAPYR